jgi:hypothetical protein
LVVQRSGIVQGSVERATEKQVLIARTVSRPTAFFSAGVIDGKYRLEVPEGDYELSLFYDRYPVMFTHVDASKSVTVDFPRQWSP